MPQSINEVIRKDLLGAGEGSEVVDPHRHADGVDGTSFDKLVADVDVFQDRLNHLLGGAATNNVAENLSIWYDSNAGVTADDTRCVRANPHSSTGF